MPASHPVRLRLAALMLCAATLSCNEFTSPGPGESAIRVINASTAAIDVAVDGIVLIHGLGPSMISGRTAVAPGTHQIRMVRRTDPATFLTVRATEGATTTTVVLATTASVLVDTGNVVPRGRSKLRIINVGRFGGEVWRTQPDFQSPTPLTLTPIVYGAQSPYLESAGGEWEVWLASADGQTKRTTTGVFTIGSGNRRTALLLDSAGTLRFRVIAE